MTNSEIVVLIYNDDSFRKLCKSKAVKPLMAEELHAEFIKTLLEIKDDRLIEAQKGNYLDVFCVGIISNLWHNRNRVKAYSTGTTSPLFEYCNSIQVDEQNYFEASREVYDTKIDYVFKAAEKVIQKELNSDCRDTMYKARVFYYSYNTMLPNVKPSNLPLNVKIENPKQFSELTGIKYTSVIATCNSVKERLKKMFKKDIND